MKKAIMSWTLGSNREFTDQLSRSEPMKWAAKRAAYLFHKGQAKRHELQENNTTAKSFQERIDSFRKTYHEELEKEYKANNEKKDSGRKGLRNKR